MRRAIVIGLAAVAMAAMGCSGGSIGDPEGSPNVGTEENVQGFLIDENTDTTLRGRLGTADGQLSFFAIAQNDETTLVNVRVNGKTFDITLDNGFVINDGHGTVLTAADRALLGSLLGELGIRFHEPASHIRSLMVNTAYLTEAPEGFVHTRYVTGMPKVAALTGETPVSTTTSEADEKVKCITAGTTVTAVYDKGTAGAKYSEPVLVGSNWGTNLAGKGDYSCMGKCGAGCGWLSTKYTKDCLDHDTCSHNLSASGGSGDTNCGDEYKNASDDYNGACTK